MQSEFLRQLSFAKANPEYAAQVQELTEFAQYAAGMQQAGKLSQREAADIEGHLWRKLIDAMPADHYAKMRQDGSFDHLEALTAHDDDRDHYSVQQDREATFKKIKADALDNAWLAQKIDAKTYAEMNRDHVGTDEDLNRTIAHEDYDGAASEAFASRHDSKPNNSQDMESYVAERFGEKPPSAAPSDEGETSSSDDPTSDYPFQVVSRSWED